MSFDFLLNLLLSKNNWILEPWFYVKDLTKANDWSDIPFFAKFKFWIDVFFT
jgi:hypothetical protein